MIMEDQFLGSLVPIILIGISTIILLRWFSTKNHDYWKKRGIPYDEPVPFFGSLWKSFTDSFHETELQRYFKLGTIYGHFEGSRPVLSVADPTLLRDIFVKDFQFFSGRRDTTSGDPIIDSMMSVIQGEDWKRVRSIVTPTFTTGKIKRMLGIFKECSETLMRNFKKASGEGKPINAKRLYGAFTMDIIASTAFSTKLDSHNDPENTFVKVAREAFGQSVNWRFAGFFLVPRLMKLFRITIFNPNSMKFFKDVTLQIIEERKRTGQVRNDFLQLLMDTAKGVAQEQKIDSTDKDRDIAFNYGEDDVSKQIFKNSTNRNLSMDELVAQCVIFFLAGYETTASTLSFASYLLALNPDIQERLREEVCQALEGTKGEFTYEAIQNMKYLDNVISETLRLYPPAVRMERLADDDYKLGDSGITIPKGMIVTVPAYAMHRDPKFFPDPEKFQPDRFTQEERAKRDQYAYLPFGVGPRNCVGMRFALMEIKVCLALVVTNFNIKRCQQTKVPLEFHKGQGLLQVKEIIVEMELRKDSSLQ